MTESKPSRGSRRKRRRIIGVLLAGAVGAGIGQICPMLPPAQQIYCHVAAKVLAFLAGGAP